MKSFFRNLLKYLFLWVVGGATYYAVEVGFRGYSFLSMAFVGGLCFIICGLLNEKFTWTMPLISQMFISTFVITFLELISGIILNTWLNLGVWDYSNLPYNFMGQICLLFSVIWFFFSIVPIMLDDYIRYFILHEDKPKYKIFM